MTTKIYLVVSYSDGALAAYKDHALAEVARDSYNVSGLYPLHDTYIQGTFLVE